MRAALALVLLAAATSASGTEEPARWYVQIDNDVPFYTDRWYSSGVRIGRVKDDVEWGLLQEVYTPDAKRWTPGRSERVPVGRLLLTHARHQYRPGVFQTLELAAGVRGPAALGRQATQAIHQLIPAPEVDWSRQLENRFDAYAAFVQSRHLMDNLRAHYGAVLGNQVSLAHAGLELRFGAKSALSSPLLRFVATPPFDAAHGWSTYLGASARAIGRNELIADNYDRFRPEISPRRAVGRAVAGVAWVQPWGAVTFEVAQDSREFDAQRSPHRFGALAIHVAF